MEHKIKEIPDINETIIRAIDNGNLLIFIGAGISRLYGFPSWKELGEILVAECFNTGCISASEKDTILNSGFTPMEILTIAFNKLKAKNRNPEKIIKSNLSCNKCKKVEFKNRLNKIAELLNIFNCRIVTTNADLSLDNTRWFKKEKIIHDFHEINCNSNEARLIHLHGSIHNFESMVFTSEQYGLSYIYDSQFGKNINNLFRQDSKNVVLFIGYGLTELELLRYFLKSKDYHNMFLLKGYLEKDDIKYELENNYFNSLGIEIIPYLIEKGYSQLITVLEKWAKYITKNTFVNVIKAKNIIEILKKCPNRNSVRKIKTYLYTETRTVIKTICQSNYLQDWILALKKEEKLFSLSNFKSCEIIDGGKQYKTKFWDGLDILISYAKSNCVNKRVDDFIISLINQCIDKLDADRETDPLKKLNSSYAIMDNLIDLVLSRKNYIVNIDLFKLIKHSLNCPSIHFYNLSKSFCDFINANELDGKICRKLFNSIKLLISYKNNYVEIESFTSKINNLLLLIPNEVYEYSKNELLKKPEFEFYDMNSFYLYPDNMTFNKTNAILIYWLKLACKYIDLSIIESDIKLMAKSKKELAKKMSLYLLNSHFISFQSKYQVLLPDLFKDKTYFSDLIELIKNNVNVFKTNNDLFKSFIQNIYNAKFNEKKNSLLINYLLKIFKINGFKVVVDDNFTQKETAYIANLNRHFYIRSIDSEAEKQECKKKFKHLNFIEALKNYKKLCSEKQIFGDIIVSAFVEYIIESEVKIKSIIKLLDEKIIVKLLLNEQICDDDSLFILKYDFSENNYKKHIDLVLFKLSRIDLKKYGQIIAFLLIKIDIKLLVKNTELLNFENECINTPLFLYCELFLSLIKNDYLKIKDFYVFIDKAKKVLPIIVLKAVVTYFLYLEIELDKLFYDKNSNFCFQNNVNGFNPSYLMLSYNFAKLDNSIKALVFKRNDFTVYIKNMSKNSSNFSFESFFSEYIKCFIANLIDKDLFDIFIENAEISTITRALELLNEYLKHKNVSIKNLKYAYFKIFKKIESTKFEEDFTISYLISAICNSILYSNDFIDGSWSILNNIVKFLKFNLPQNLFDICLKFYSSHALVVCSIFSKILGCINKYNIDKKKIDLLRKIALNNKKIEKQLNVKLSELKLEGVVLAE